MMETRKPFDVIRLHDPAIDWDAVKRPQPCPNERCSNGLDEAVDDGRCETCGGEGFVRLYDEGRFCTERDLEKVLVHTFPGETPVYFVCRRLTTPQRQKYISLATSHDDEYVRAFQAGVIEIRFPDRPKYVPKWLAKGALTMDDKELRDLEKDHGIEWPDLLDVGSQILARSNVPFGCTPSYPVLRSSVDAWVAVQRLCAERRASAAPPSSDGPKAP
ncbi:hypothetical protein [Sandaracinus amylolyticus]|uniref:hypothetical protein n=1 Tax=Sandaracinus amylolyticus TaxID=927083 RepID=UPI001F490ED2|nr:hypothetical protein [Sandaracinus amylolyticus]UJR81490.1 Hypothetical protein I5071_35500 [Sandaracinus amylolyticus]